MRSPCAGDRSPREPHCKAPIHFEENSEPARCRLQHPRSRIDRARHRSCAGWLRSARLTTRTRASGQHSPKCLHPPCPSCPNAPRSFGRPLCLIEALLDERVVQRTENQRPRHDCPSSRHHSQLVAQECRTRGTDLGVERVIAVESTGTGKAELYVSRRSICHNNIANRPVTTGGADAEGTI